VRYRFPSIPKLPIFATSVLLLAAGAASAIDLQVALRTPRLEGLVASIPVDGAAPVLVDVALAFDAKGKLVCGGTCRVDGAVVDVKGKVGHKNGSSVYQLVLKGRDKKVQVKFAGDPTSGTAAVDYRGPKGRTSGEHAVAIARAPAVATISVFPHVDAKGKLTGTGAVTSGFNNDQAAPGALKGKRKGDALKWTLKAGARKVSFAGRLAGEDFVGTLTLKLPPEKGTFDAPAVPEEVAELPGPNAGKIVLAPYVPADVVPDPTGGSARIVSGRILVDFEKHVELATIDAKLAAHALRRIGIVGAINLVTAEILDDKTELEAQAAIEIEPEVEGAPLAYLLENASAGEKLPGPVPAGTRPEVPRDFDLGKRWTHYLMDTFAAHGLAEAIRGERLSDVTLAVVDAGFHRQPGDERSDTDESLLVDSDNFDMVSKVVAPIATELDLGGGELSKRPDVVVGEIAAESNPLLFLLDFVIDGEDLILLNDIHGLRVASVAVAAGRDSFLGTGKHVKLIPVRWQAWVVGDDIGVTGPNGVSIPVVMESADYAAAALTFLAEVPDPNLKVLTMSWGSLILSSEQRDRIGDAVFDALRLHERQGRILVAAAGNDARDADAFHPASLSVVRNPLGGSGGGDRLESLMAVSGTSLAWNEFLDPGDTTDPDLELLGERLVFDGQREQSYGNSNTGDVISVSAPAESVPVLDWLSTPPLYGFSHGTSYAAPAVAGLAAELFAVDPSARASEVIDAIQRTADDLVGLRGAPGWDPVFGHGRVNAWKALLALVNRTDPERPKWLGIRFRSTLEAVKPERLVLGGDAVPDTILKRVPELPQAAGDNTRAIPYATTDETATASLFSFEAKDLDPARADLQGLGQVALFEVTAADGTPSYQIPLRLQDVMDARPLDATGLDDFVLTIEQHSADHGSIYGRVTADGDPVAGAAVRYAARAGGQKTTVTDADGYYTAYDVAVGAPFELTAEKDDAARSVPGVQVAPLLAVRVNVDLTEEPLPSGSFVIEAYLNRNGDFGSNGIPGFDPSRADIQLSGSASTPILTWGSATPEGPKPNVSRVSIELQPSHLGLWGIEDVAWSSLPPAYDTNVIAPPVTYGDVSVPGTRPFSSVPVPSPALVPGTLYQARVLWFSSPGFTRSAWVNFRVE
jgi:hypothetical protein